MFPKMESNLEIHVPCYNEQGNILKFLKSLQAQTYKSFRVIVHDNGSTDKTPEICRVFCKGDPRFELDSIPINTHVINQLIRIKFSPRSDFIGQLSVNDFISDDYLLELMRVITQDESIGLVYSHGYLHNLKDGVDRDPGDHCSFDTRGMSPIEGVNEVMARYTHAFPLWGIYRRRVLERLRPMQFVYGGDHVFVAEVALYSKIAKVARKVNWRTGGTSTDEAVMKHNTLIQLEEYARGIHPTSFFYGAAQNMPFLNMIWGHIEMFSFAHTDEATKYTLIHSAAAILNSRFHPFIDQEVGGFLGQCEQIIAHYGVTDLSGYDKTVLLTWFKKLSAELYKIAQVPGLSKFAERLKAVMTGLNGASLRCF